MDKNKKLSIVSTIMAIILSDIMSAHVAIVYCNKSASFPFLVAIPYIIIILATLTNSYILWKKSEVN